MAHVMGVPQAGSHAPGEDRTGPDQCYQPRLSPRLSTAPLTYDAQAAVAGGQSQVRNLDLAAGAMDQDVVTLEVPGVCRCV